MGQQEERGSEGSDGKLGSRGYQGADPGRTRCIQASEQLLSEGASLLGVGVGHLPMLHSEKEG